MSKPVEIPQDIIDSVIAEVGDDTDLLKQCSLVSSSFLFSCRRKLFSSITIGSDESCQGIHQLLVQNPVIQSFVRAITVTRTRSERSDRFPQWMNGTSLPAILRLPFSFLECFSIFLDLLYSDPKPWNWNSFSGELKDALSNIIHSPNLKTLSLQGITKVPITFFLQIVHLTTLELHSVSVKDFEIFVDENSNSLVPMASQMVINRCVWRLSEGLEYKRGYEYVPSTRFPSFTYFSLIWDGEGRTQLIFLPFMCRLRSFEIYVGFDYDAMLDFDIFLTFLMGSLRISLTSPATLEHLKFYIEFRGNEIGLVFQDEFCGNLRDAEVWSHLDSITTLPTCSLLQRVDIVIDYCLCEKDYNTEPDEDDVLEAVLDNLPLLLTKGILFVEAYVGR